MRTRTTEATPNPKLDRSFLYQAVSTQSGLTEDLLDSQRYEDLIRRTVERIREKLVGQEAPLTKLEHTLKAKVAERFIGWDEAVRTLTPTWDRRPITSVLAVGPTGVGKSETGKMLADILFGGRLIALNGSEVGPDAPHATSMWMGSPPGYVGSDRGGVLSNGLRIHRSGIILIDELEKADKSAIQNILMPLMGEGCMTDKNNGETLYATDFIVFCTSNIPVAPENLRAIGFDANQQSHDPDARAIFDALSAYLLPETIGRFNAILSYQALSLETQWRVWSALRHDLAAKIGTGTQIVLDEDAKRFVQNMFKNIETGARGIRDLFLEQVVPLTVGAEAGTTINIGCIENRLSRVNRSAKNGAKLQDKIRLSSQLMSGES